MDHGGNLHDFSMWLEMFDLTFQSHNSVEMFEFWDTGLAKCQTHVSDRDKK